MMKLFQITLCHNLLSSPNCVVKIPSARKDRFLLRRIYLRIGIAHLFALFFRGSHPCQSNIAYKELNFGSSR